MDVAHPRPAHGERGGQRDLRVLLPGQAGEALRDVHVGRAQHAGVVERAQQRGRAQRDVGRERVGLREAHPRPSSTSLSRVTSAADGRHENTPHGVSPITGVAGPTMPRRNRYSTPARLRSGS